MQVLTDELDELKRRRAQMRADGRTRPAREEHEEAAYTIDAGLPVIG